MESRYKSFLLSAFLHGFLLFCMLLFIYVGDFFKTEEIDDKLVFEMVEAPPKEFQSLEEDTYAQPDSFIVEQKLEEAKPIELPEAIIIPEPEPIPQTKPKVEPKKAEQKKTEPKPEPKKAEPKPIAKPEPKKVTFAEFKRDNPTKPQSQVKASVTPKIKVAAITYDGSNLDKITAANIGSTNMSGLALKNVIQAYLQSINATAKAKWTLPSECMGMKLSVDILFNISAAGVVNSIRVQRSSGNKDFDNSVIAVFSRLKLSSTPTKTPMENVSLTFESN